MAQRPPLTRERIIEAALHLIDAQGLARLTMRRLGDILEVEAMAIYHHLPHGKEQLLEGLITHVAAFPVPASDEDRLRDWAVAYRARLLEHAGVLPLLVTRRAPGALESTTASVRAALRARGATEDRAAAGAHTLPAYLIGHAAAEARGRAAGTHPDIDWDTLFIAGLDQVLTGIDRTPV